MLQSAWTRLGVAGLAAGLVWALVLWSLAS
jgi:tetrahydromethanopterin S-methyltransferase subunit F